MFYHFQGREFKPGDKVLVFLTHDDQAPDCFAFPLQGLGEERYSHYLLSLLKGAKLYHANLLKWYQRRAHMSFAEVIDEDIPPAHCKTSVVTADNEEDSGHLPVAPDGQTVSTDCQQPLDSPLTQDQRADLEDSLPEFKDVSSDIPGCTPAIQHNSCPSTTNRIRAKMFPVLTDLKPHFEQEVNHVSG